MAPESSNGLWHADLRVSFTQDRLSDSLLMNHCERPGFFRKSQPYSQTWQSHHCQNFTSANQTHRCFSTGILKLFLKKYGRFSFSRQPYRFVLPSDKIALGSHYWSYRQGCRRTQMSGSAEKSFLGINSGPLQFDPSKATFTQITMFFARICGHQMPGTKKLSV